MTNQKPTKAIMNTDLESAPFFRRFAAYLLDFASFAFISFLIFLAFRPILNSTMNVNAKINEYNAQVVASKLYATDADGSPSTNMYVGLITPINVSQTEYAEATYRFYVDFMAVEYADEENAYDHDWFLVHILEIDQEQSFYVLVDDGSSVPLRAVDSDSPSHDSTSSTTSELTEEDLGYDTFLPAGVALKEGVTVEQITKKNGTMYVNASNQFNALQIVVDANNYALLETMVSFILASTIVYLTVPLLLKNGQTLGKLALKLGLANRPGYQVSNLKIVFRYIAIFILYIITLAVFVPGFLILGFVSLTMAVFSKKTSTLHDLIAGTRVYDIKKSILYFDEDEFIEAHRIDNLIEEER